MSKFSQPVFTEHLHQIVDIGAGKGSKDAASALQSLCLQDLVGILRDILHVGCDSNSSFRWEQHDPPKLWAPAAEILQSSWHLLCILRETQFEHLETEMARISPMITSWPSWHVKQLNHRTWHCEQVTNLWSLCCCKPLKICSVFEKEFEFTSYHNYHKCSTLLASFRYDSTLNHKSNQSWRANQTSQTKKHEQHT